MRLDIGEPYTASAESSMTPLLRGYASKLEFDGARFGAMDSTLSRTKSSQSSPDNRRFGVGLAAKAGNLIRNAA